MTGTRYWQLQDAEWLRERYERQSLSTYAIAAEIGTSAQVVGRALRRHGIASRPLSEARRLEFGMLPLSPDRTRIPLHRRDKSIRAWTVIDEEDFDALTTTTWHLMSGYAQSKTLGLMHRHLLGLMTGDGREADHLNRDRLDNRRRNLTIVSRQENAQNVPARGGSSRHRGVRWDSSAGCWVARATLGGVEHYLGAFGDEGEANAVAVAWRREHMPFSFDARGRS